MDMSSRESRFGAQLAARWPGLHVLVSDQRTITWFDGPRKLDVARFLVGQGVDWARSPGPDTDPTTQVRNQYSVTLGRVLRPQTIRLLATRALLDERSVASSDDGRTAMSHLLSLLRCVPELPTLGPTPWSAAEDVAVTLVSDRVTLDVTEPREQVRHVLAAVLRLGGLTRFRATVAMLSQPNGDAGPKLVGDQRERSVRHPGVRPPRAAATNNLRQHTSTQLSGSG
jgi:hypothetical protein